MCSRTDFALIRRHQAPSCSAGPGRTLAEVHVDLEIGYSYLVNGEVGCLGMENKVEGDTEDSNNNQDGYQQTEDAANDSAETAASTSWWSQRWVIVISWIAFFRWNRRASRD